MATQYTTPMGRIVGGHPMEYRAAKDDHGNVKISDRTGQPVMQSFFYFALPKNGTVDWKTQTEWGQIFLAEAQAGFPKGQYNAADFAWKVVDGDSPTPMKGGKAAPNAREGWPGHWILRLSQGFEIRCYDSNIGFGELDQLQDKKHIKCGDYGRVRLDVEANGSDQSPGLYVNPTIFSFDRAGEFIRTAGEDAAEVFGQTPPAAGNQQTSAGAPAANLSGVAAPPPPPPTTAAAPPPHDPTPKYSYNGTQYTREQLIAAGWPNDQIDALPTV